MSEEKKYKIGYCPGAFDMFHRGHLNLLKNSKDKCEYLIAGVVTDEVYTSYKLRPPVVPFEDRLEIVAQCKYVDKAIAVTPYLHDKWNAFKELHYDAHFAGSDHTGAWPELEAALNAEGSELVFFPYTEIVSSTDLKVNLEKDGVYRQITGERQEPVIVLFGAGGVGRHYLESYVDECAPNRLPKNLWPSFIVDNDSSKWGSKLSGIDIRDPRAILEVPREKLCVLIASNYGREISAQLIEMGVTDYRFLDEATLPTWEELEVAKKKSAAKSMYVPDDRQRRVWEAELNILDEIEKICNRHGLKYYAMYGTLLGAVRHKGFIPWDDDLDIGMLREEFELFAKYAKEELPEYMSIYTIRNSTDILRTNIRVCDNRTTAIEEPFLNRKSRGGIWVDIDPIEISYSDYGRYLKKRKKVHHNFRLLHAKIKAEYANYDLKHAHPLKYAYYRIAPTLMSREHINERLISLSCMGDNDALNRADGSVDISFAPELYRQLKAEDFADTVKLEFEGRMISAPAGYERVLFELYGSDYMKLPPIEEQRPKHSGIMDPDRPYTFYEDIFTGIFDNTKGKQIILFGAGQMFDDYMRKWGRKYRPSFTVDNDESKWDRTRLGIPVKNPQDILKIPASKRKVIICSFYYREIEKQLQEMGVEYSVYIQHIEWVVHSEKEDRT